MSYSLAIIGLGKIAWKYDLGQGKNYGLTHLSAAQKSNCFGEYFFCEVDERKRREFSQATKKETCGSIHELPKGLDVIVIATETTNHKNSLLEAMSLSPRLILLEKPIGSTTREIEDMEILNAVVPTKIFVNFQRRVDPNFLSLASVLKHGKQNSNYEAIFTFTGSWIENGSHAWDLANMLFELDYTTGQSTRVSENMMVWLEPNIKVVFIKIDLEVSVFQFEIFGEGAHYIYRSGCGLKSISRSLSEVFDQVPVYGGKREIRVVDEGLNHVYNNVVDEIKSGNSHLLPLRDAAITGKKLLRNLGS